MGVYLKYGSTKTNEERQLYIDKQSKHKNTRNQTRILVILLTDNTTQHKHYAGKKENMEETSYVVLALRLKYNT